ncbi:hypothetical protein BDK51DRAFT_35036 [Blyttiomyces helicus]|uniref:RWD domain-containing protein n=1 Tax=Blyttiomyces helicus TaxID=388810 RepID=A0A4P9W5D5_9FUNG|nr:hypothetical protein BDK51DRAFT_35036 [Blyttiomyces helicus]|eukprot:RKO87609.1 hypothetical protein BDK51DRAFT_35036 [Blyttiomyces helicus]
MSQTPDDENKDRQENELLALKAIFDSDFTYKTGVRLHGALVVHLESADDAPFLVQVSNRNTADRCVLLSSPSPLTPFPPPFQPASPSESPETAAPATPPPPLSVAHLPPITLRFHLPPGYPETEPPSFVLECIWIDIGPMKGLMDALNQIWEAERCEVCVKWPGMIADGTARASDGIGLLLNLAREWNDCWEEGRRR